MGYGYSSCVGTFCVKIISSSGIYIYIYIYIYI